MRMANGFGLIHCVVCGSQRYNMDYEAKNRMEELMSRRNYKPPGVDRGHWTLQEVGRVCLLGYHKNVQPRVAPTYIDIVVLVAQSCVTL